MNPNVLRSHIEGLTGIARKTYDAVPVAEAWTFEDTFANAKGGLMMSKSNETLRFPRTQREAGWTPNADWDDDSPRLSTWAAMLGWGIVGAALLWLFFVIVLGWSA